MPSLILASASPRRRELLALLGLPFEVRAAGIDETPQTDETPVEYVSRVAKEKAEAISNLQSPNNEIRELEIVIAADTEVVVDGEILGKPRSAEEARAMLVKLRGRTHEVMSAVAIFDRRSEELHEELCHSEVPMRNYSDEALADYVATGDPLDKAGAYAIQHNGFRPVENFSHCYASVMGLPLCHLTRALRRLGIEPPADVPATCQQFNNYQCPVYKEILETRENKETPLIR
ncbi:MAG: septum formation protein Maf [Chloroflexi bacterium]|nr:septum formation protein Maf [Chloroflexota bacterium]